MEHLPRDNSSADRSDCRQAAEQWRFTVLDDGFSLHYTRYKKDKRRSVSSTPAFACTPSEHQVQVIRPFAEEPQVFDVSE